jgi:hypothetical protein
MHPIAPLTRPIDAAIPFRQARRLEARYEFTLTFRTPIFLARRFELKASQNCLMEVGRAM